MGTPCHHLTFRQYHADLIMCRSFVPLPKSSQHDRVVSNADVFDFELSPEDMAGLDALDKGDAGAISWNPVNAP